VTTLVRAGAATGAQTERLLAFEIGGSVYAVPIADVAEVADLGRIAAVPTLPQQVGGVMNHHGDALPIVHRGALFEVAVDGLAEPQHVLVLARSPDDHGTLGVPVDRILGLVDGSGGVARGADAVVERRPIDGRVVSVLDARRLLRRAAEVIERSVLAAGAVEGGEA
jgi:chemotaxis signal transduction protein